jgi:transcriptional regulator with XRE-family HTH domain
MLGKKISKIRHLKGFTQEYVANKIGLSQQAYSRIESNETKLDTERLQKIADLFGVTTQEIERFDTDISLTTYGNGAHIKGTFAHQYHENTKAIEVLEQVIKFQQAQIDFLNTQINANPRQ